MEIPQTARAASLVELAGRRINWQRHASIWAAIFALDLYLQLSVRLTAGDVQRARFTCVVVTASLAGVTVLAAVRRLGVWICLRRIRDETALDAEADQARKDAEADQARKKEEADAPSPPPPQDAGQQQSTGLVICCSGGGIKSAAFGLGALQALDEARTYEKADFVVAVSGGGYIAAAFATLRYRRWAANPGGPVRAFAPGSREVAELRRRTNYLASSPRVKFDLVASVLFGIVVNVMIVGSSAAVMAWLVAQHGRAMLWVPADVEPWVVTNASTTAWPLVVTAVLAGASGAYFLFCRYGDLWPGAGRRAQGVSRAEQPTAGTWRYWLSNLPNSLVGAALFFVVLEPLALVAAELLRDFRAQPHPIAWWYIGWVRVGTVLTAVTGFVTLTRSWLQGAKPSKRATSTNERLVQWLQKRAAPVVAMMLFLGALYLAYLALIDSLLSVPEAQFGYGQLLVPAVTLGLATCLGSANRTSLFPFYRDRLDRAFLQHDPAQDPATAAGADPTTRPVDLRQLSGDGSPGPRLVLCATANVKDGDILPTGRNGTPFILSAEIGVTDTNLPAGPCLLTVSQYAEGGGRHLDVASAIAISGAAVSPVAGREDKLIGAHRLLLAFANIRLGVWLRNPYWTLHKADKRRWRRWVMALNDRLDTTTPFQVLEEALGSPSVYLPSLYVTDGGHYDNLGLVEALRRRPERIIVLDGSGDAEDEFPTMGNAIATARMDLGVEIRFDPSPMQRTREGHGPPPSGWAQATATYPDDGGKCRIDYVKCVLPAGLSWDLTSYQIRHKEFPATTQSQLYDEFDFEAYRQLGWSLVQQAERDGWRRL